MPETYKEYRTRKNTESKGYWRERVYESPRRAAKFRSDNAARERSRRVNLPQEQLLTLRKRHAENERIRVAALSPDSRTTARQIHADSEFLRMKALPEVRKADLRKKKTERQRQKRAEMSEEEKKKQRENDAKRKRDKRTTQKQFRKKIQGHLKDKSNPMPLWLLCDIFMDNRNVHICEMDPFPKYHTYKVEFRGKPLDLYMPKFKPSPENNFCIEMNKKL